MKIDTPTDLLNYFLSLSSSFSVRWNSEDNYNVEEDKSFTFCGVCNEFAHYFIDQERFKELRMPARFKVHWEISLDEKNVIDIFNFIEETLTYSGNEKLKMSLKSCFLEDISSTFAGEYAKEFMGDKSLNFFLNWHVAPK